MAALSDPTALLGAALRLVVVASVDRADATCRVRDGAILSGDLPWLAGRAGDVRIWSAPSVGEQALLVCPEGDMLAGIVLPGVYSNANPAPADDASTTIVFADDGRLAYDPAGHALDIVLPAGATVHIDAQGGVTIDAPVTIKGDVTVQGDVAVSGTVTAGTDVVGAGKSLKGHKHTGVQSGGAISGPPQ